MVTITGYILYDLIAIVVLVFGVTYAVFQRNYQFWKRKGVPYFQPSFPLGNLQPFYKHIQLPIDLFNIVKKAKDKGWKYFGIYMLAKPFFVPLDVDLIKLILTKDFNYFNDRGFYYNEKDDPLSAHLFAIGGVKWKNLRAKLTPTFTSGKLKMMFQILVDAGEDLEKFLKESDKTKPIHIKKVLSSFTTNIIGSCAFGIECNALKEPNSPFVKNGQKVLETNILRQIKDMFYTSYPNFARALHLKFNENDVIKFYYDIVTKTVNFREKNNVTRNDFLQLLLNLKNNAEDEAIVNTGDGKTLTMDQVVSQCFVFFIAGFETSASTMTFALFELARHPEAQEKARKEIFEVLKKHDNKITYDSMQELSYLQQVLNETLRIYPPVPFITRECVEDYKIPGTDITLDKGTGILIHLRNVHNFEEFYENPDEFDPDRFTAENNSKRPQYAYIPFGEGPRICIGKRFGLMQAKVGLVSVLRNYRVKLSPLTKTPIEFDPDSFVVPRIKGGCWITLEEL